MDVLNELINKRDELAKILGFDSYADLDIAPEMAKTRGNVEAFLDQLLFAGGLALEKSWDTVRQLTGAAGYLVLKSNEIPVMGRPVFSRKGTVADSP